MKVLLLANDTPGYRVTKFLVNRGDTIVRLYLHSKDSQKRAEDIVTASRLPKKRIFLDVDLRDKKHIAALKKLDIDYVITVFWKWILPKDILSIAKKGTVNFHPALLPVGRGWFPHVHSIAKNMPVGVTIHAMDAFADTGPIWAQKKVSIKPYETALDVYLKLQDEIVKLFINTWPKIINGTIKPKKQNELNAVYYKKSDIDLLDRIDLDKNYTGAELLNLLRARSFGERGFAYFEVNGERVYINLRLGLSSNFSEQDNK
jgi:methionyl-tRNA formyltransferase